MLKGVFGPKRGELTEELGWACSVHGRERKIHNILTGKPEDLVVLVDGRVILKWMSSKSGDRL